MSAFDAPREIRVSRCNDVSVTNISARQSSSALAKFSQRPLYRIPSHVADGCKNKQTLAEKIRGDQSKVPTERASIDQIAGKMQYMTTDLRVWISYRQAVSPCWAVRFFLNLCVVQDILALTCHRKALQQNHSSDDHVSVEIQGRSRFPGLQVMLSPCQLCREWCGRNSLAERAL